ncbi:HNH endonuclease [Halobacteriovorax sp. DA5]|uniref:HNH endonuclease n=1 Tax=Halobacteriovorax sp. DA5 TaxID=2067553 RepID=UPI000CD11A01|nr:HNH endonuclease [Halobacteriovorax sp. DA5]POB13848.1 HNH endonuclease [Halobacteriovorax sp. DA5]
MSISKKYLDTLNTIEGWTTVSEWAIRVGELHPEILEKANKEAENQKNETTGLREIAARISSNISRGAYSGHIEIDDSERPRKVRFLTESEANVLLDRELEDDLAPLTRAQKIKHDESLLTTKDKYRLQEFENISSQLRSFFNLDFELEHAKALLNKEDPGQHHPDNIQLLLKSHNRMKSSSNWDRFTLEEQIEYIQAAVKVQKLVSKKMRIDLEEEVIGQIINRIKLVF